MAEVKEITAEDARQNLETWLDMAAHNSTYNKYDELCSRAYDLLGHDEYKMIYDRWTSGYVHCDDGLYRRR
jgi:hypothetical protein